MGQFLQELSKLSPGVLAVIVALAGAFGAIISAIVTAIVGKFFVSPFLGARDKQDKEVEWRKHAIELTKLDLERKLRTRVASDTKPLRPSILDFLANYRDLQELGEKEAPKDVYEKVKSRRTNLKAFVVAPITLADGVANEVYPQTTLNAMGGTPPLKWSVAPELPEGLKLDSATGVLSGKPTVTFSKTIFTITVNDSAKPAAESNLNVALEIKNRPLALAPITLADGVANQVYPKTTLKAIGGIPPLRWSVTPELPKGLKLDPATGILDGTPTATLSKTTFTITVTDSAACSESKVPLEIKDSL